MVQQSLQNSSISLSNKIVKQELQYYHTIMFKYSMRYLIYDLNCCGKWCQRSTPDISSPCKLSDQLP